MTGRIASVVTRFKDDPRAHLNHAFGQPSHGAPWCGFPVRSLLALFDDTTNLLFDPEAYPKPELVELYGQRGEVETNLRHLKHPPHALGLDVLKTKTEAGVMKELWAFAIIYHLIRLIRRGGLDAAQRQKVPPNRISFADALDALRYHRPDAHIKFKRSGCAFDRHSRAGGNPG